MPLKVTGETIPRVYTDFTVHAQCYFPYTWGSLGQSVAPEGFTVKQEAKQPRPLLTTPGVHRLHRPGIAES